jgi:hypothetical protein
MVLAKRAAKSAGAVPSYTERATDARMSEFVIIASSALPYTWTSCCLSQFRLAPPL